MLMQHSQQRQAQIDWAGTPLRTRLAVLRKARHQLARTSDRLVGAISSDLARTRADSYAAEVLPLLAACRFLEQNARRILRPRRLGRKGLPFWLAGIDSTIERVPFGTILVIAPSNYPLFLAGVQTLQALAAGNSVIWKPGRGGRAVAEVVQQTLERAGLPESLVRVTEESADAAVAAIQEHPDKIFFTGSAQAGRSILHLAADLTIPVVAELSGCDAVVALPSADPELLMQALEFGMRLNGSATCMAPRRLILVGGGHDPLIAGLRQRFAEMDAVELTPNTRSQLQSLLQAAERDGSNIYGNAGALLLKPILILDGRAEMEIAQADIFAPVLTVLRAEDIDSLLTTDQLCPYGLTISIFGNEAEARALGAQLQAGTVLINDLIVPTADPRVPFGGRRASGFGVTRGAEGLLEMCAVKVTAARQSRTTRHYEPTSASHEQLFRWAVEMSHSGTLRERFAGLRKLIAAAKTLK